MLLFFVPEPKMHFSLWSDFQFTLWFLAVLLFSNFLTLNVQRCSQPEHTLDNYRTSCPENHRMFRLVMALLNEPDLKIIWPTFLPWLFFHPTVCCCLVVSYFFSLCLSVPWPLEVSAAERCRNHLWLPSSRFKPLRFWSSNHRAGPPPPTNPSSNHSKYLSNKTPEEKPFYKNHLQGLCLVWLIALDYGSMSGGYIRSSLFENVLKASVVKPVLNPPCLLGSRLNSGKIHTCSWICSAM